MLKLADIQSLKKFFATKPWVRAQLGLTPGQSSTVVTLTGGGATALNGTNGVLDGSTVFTLGRFVALNLTGLGLKWVVLQAGTNATDGVSFIRPANYNASTFAYVFAVIG